ncbi:MAG TPA: ParB/RepB/Spo0J family partition protein [Symbiobacteriaceae bacterium]|nr:ParB/RepB/Spo0J family partition protein [Symbiobacteriaceae bacterium]
MITYRLATGNRGFFEYLEQHPQKGNDWVAPAEYDDGVDSSTVVIRTPEGADLVTVQMSPRALTDIKSKIEMDMIKRRRPSSPAPAPAQQGQGPGMGEPKHGRQTFKATTGDELIASVFKSVQTERWILDVVHVAGCDGGFLQLLDAGGAKIVKNVPCTPRGNLKQRVTDALNAYIDGKAEPNQPASVTPPAPAATTQASQARPVDPAERPADVQVRYLAIEDILTGDNVRTEMGDLEELAADIKRRGVKQPLTVREAGGKFKLVAGERRLRAARLAGLRWVPCLVDEDDEARAIEWMLSENEHRKALSPIEEARGYQRLMAILGTQEAVAQAVSKSRVHVTEYLQLLSLPDELQQQVATGYTPVKTALEYLRRTRDDSADVRRQVAAGLAQEKTSTRQAGDTVERLRQEAGAAPAPRRETPPPTPPASSPAPPPAPAPQSAPAPAPAPTPAAPPAPPSQNVARATNLHRVGERIWDQRLSGQAKHERLAARYTCLPLADVKAHWARRAELGAAMMPATTGRSIVDIPEQRVWFGDTLQLEQNQASVEVWDGDIAITLPQGCVRAAYDGSPVYYRVELIRTGDVTIGMLQQLVIQEGDRHIVVTGAAAAAIEYKQVEAWRKMIAELPCMPAV